MDNDSQPFQGGELPGDHLSRLSAAGLRINENLDIDTALRAVMDSARSLTHAPYAAIITLDASGQVDDHLVLGFDPADVERLWQAPQGEMLFEYLNTLPGPLRVGNLSVGSDEPGREFTQEDEETLVMFARSREGEVESGKARQPAGAAQAGRGRQQPQVHLRRAAGGVLDARGGRSRRWLN